MNSMNYFTTHKMKRALIVSFLSLICALLFAQEIPIHRSGITPPPIPGVLPHLRHHPKNSMDLYVPPGKQAEMLFMGNMQMEEILDRFRTNRYNSYLIVFTPEPSSQVHQAMITAEDELVLSNYHRGVPQHP